MKEENNNNIYFIQIIFVKKKLKKNIIFQKKCLDIATPNSKKILLELY